MNKKLPFDSHTVDVILDNYPSPLYVYDEKGIRSASQKLNTAFDWNEGFKNYFAVKALPNPKILEILRNEGMGLDCSSLVELLLAQKINARGQNIMFSSNDTTAIEFKKARELDAIINLDDIAHLKFLEETAGLPELICFRYNPGNQVIGNTIIGQPEDAKFGMTKKQILESIGVARQKGVRQFGLHIMAISNNLDYMLSLQIVKILFDLAKEIRQKYGIKLKFINLGGGIGIPYKPDDKDFDINEFSKQVKKLLESTLDYETKIYMECGRYITGPYGYLITKVLHIKRTYKTFIGLDASMHNLMRPGMYDAYHHISILSNDSKGQHKQVYDVTGSLCENNDKFAIDRKLPKVKIGDILVIHDTGAHGHSMGFNYNGKLRSAELLLHEDGTVQLIRRSETPQDYFVTLV